MTEEWKIIPEFPQFSVSTEGNIKNNTTGNIRKITKCESSRYPTLTVWDFTERKRTHLKVHKVVAQAFVPNPDEKPEINHINGDKYDNRAVNLEYVTHSENMKHAHDTGICPPPPSPKRAVVGYTPDCSDVNVFSSVVEASQHTGVSCNTIYATICQKNEKPVNGIVWKKWNDVVEGLTTIERVETSEVASSNRVE